MKDYIDKSLCWAVMCSIYSEQCHMVYNISLPTYMNQIIDKHSFGLSNFGHPCIALSHLWSPAGVLSFEDTPRHIDQYSI